MTRNVEQDCRISDFVHIIGARRELVNGLDRSFPYIPRGAAGKHAPKRLVDPRHPDEVSGG